MLPFLLGEPPSGPRRLIVQMLWSLASSGCPRGAYARFLEAARFWLMANLDSPGLQRARLLRAILACFRWYRGAGILCRYSLG